MRAEVFRHGVRAENRSELEGHERFSIEVAKSLSAASWSQATLAKGSTEVKTVRGEGKHLGKRGVSTAKAIG